MMPRTLRMGFITDEQQELLVDEQHAEIVRVDVDRVRQPQLVDSARDFFDDLPGGHVEMRDVLVQAVNVPALQLLPGLDAPGVDELRGIALGGSQQPGNERLQPLRLVALNRLHERTR